MPTPSILLAKHSSNKHATPRLPPRKFATPVPYLSTPSPAKHPLPSINSTSLIVLRGEFNRVKELKKEKIEEKVLEKKLKKEKLEEKKLNRLERMRAKGLDYNGNMLSLSSTALDLVATRREEEANKAILRKQNRDRSSSLSVEPRELKQEFSVGKFSKSPGIEPVENGEQALGSNIQSIESVKKPNQPIQVLQRNNSQTLTSSSSSTSLKRKAAAKSEVERGENKRIKKRNEKSSSVESNNPSEI